MKAAFIVQGCGLEVNGGAEQLCLKIAQRMTAYRDCEILTTRAQDYVTWEDRYPAEPITMEGLLVRRFQVVVPHDIIHLNRIYEGLYLPPDHDAAGRTGSLDASARPLDPPFFQNFQLIV